MCHTVVLAELCPSGPGGGSYGHLLGGRGCLEPMHLCYVDEAGCPGRLPTANSDIQPVLVICGLVLDQAHIADLTKEFIALKQRFFPTNLPASSGFLDWILVEVKGSEIRRNAASKSRRQRRHTVGFLDKVIELLKAHNCQIIGRVWVKGIGQPFNGRSVYTASIQYIHHWFNRWLHKQDDTGIVICDSRDQALNRVVSHSVFTEKYRGAGDKHPRIIEMPTFGHSENHAGLQLSDLVCSALLFPMAVDAYCAGSITSVHVRPGYSMLRNRYGGRLENLQHREQDPTGASSRLVGGVTVNDQIGKKPRFHMFNP